MNTQPLSALAGLSYNQRSSLRKGNILTVSDLLVLSSQVIAKRCRITHGEAQEIVNLVFDELKPLPLHHLGDPDIPKDDIITTGDNILDNALGGGVRTRKLWEVTGESAAGKTQLAMQLALCVQLPHRLRGVSGSACFLSTSWTLPTNRLVEMVNNHPALSPAVCGLADIHTIKTPTIALLIHVLSDTLPAFLDGRKSQPETKPVKLLVIDAITELFHSDQAVSTTTLAERSRNLTEIATLLHILAHKHGLAVVVLNEVSDAIDRELPPNSRPHEVSYQDQARLFNRGDSIPGENSKEAALGLVWANQINARIMLTRTNRTRVLDDSDYRPHKRRRTADDGRNVGNTIVSSGSEPIRIRRLSVIFNSTAPPVSLDYIITASGFISLDLDEPFLTTDISTIRGPSNAAPPLAPLEDVCPLDLPLAINSSAGPSSDPSLPSSANFTGQAASSLGDVEPDLLLEGLDAENGPQDEDDEWETYWKDGDLGSDVYSQVDLEALSSGL
ncbi:P-loop containing nucleoside triphosphate hydrolase protein [Irpex rosettiformis]|uniref:P-loop containing nucleoside triphosphate hydrolase protein n=1 Tax=Irpex rosettiformis TaxID=378272 RepID=A0ACB8TQA9_9APHY|nr:P-loop containing nucleoside triphosphate hydrolase protein [Irpex rosettiformis]